jgi:signal peptidase I
MTSTITKSQKKGICENIISTVIIFVIALFICLTFRYTKVLGDSMMPTFNDGDRLIVSNLFYEPQRGDVVVFNDKTNTGYDGTPIIKRIIALEGDVVKIEGGIIYVKENGNDDFSIVNYVDGMDIPHSNMNERIVSKGEMFVMGDNVNLSLDSRDPTVGMIKVDSIIGKVILRFYAEELVYSEADQDYKSKGRIVFDTDFITAK